MNPARLISIILPLLTGAVLLTAASIATAEPSAGERVLIAGGAEFWGPSRTALLFNPQTRNFTHTGNMTTPRIYHADVLMHDGRVLLVGGTADNMESLKSAELYDPESGMFAAAGELNTAREVPFAIRLKKGQVLVVGGYNSQTGLVQGSAELYRPSSGIFTDTGSLPAPYVASDVYERATILQDGQLLISELNTYDVNAQWPAASLYDPVSGTFRLTGHFTLGRLAYSATPLDNGKVLITGGSAGGCPGGDDTTRAELYDRTTGRFSMTGSMRTAREFHTATKLKSGKVLIAGGQSAVCDMVGGVTVSYPTATELYDPDKGTFTASGDMTDARYGHTATLLDNGEVLIAGGGQKNRASAETYDPSDGKFTPTADMPGIRSDHTATHIFIHRPESDRTDD